MLAIRSLVCTHICFNDRFSRDISILIYRWGRSTLASYLSLHCLLFIGRERVRAYSTMKLCYLCWIWLTIQVLAETRERTVNPALFCFLLLSFYTSFLGLENEEKTRPMNRENDNHNAKIFLVPLCLYLPLCFLRRDFSTTLLFTCSSIYRQNIGILSNCGRFFEYYLQKKLRNSHWSFPLLDHSKFQILLFSLCPSWTLCLTS